MVIWELGGKTTLCTLEVVTNKKNNFLQIPVNRSNSDKRAHVRVWVQMPQEAYGTMQHGKQK